MQVNLVYSRDPGRAAALAQELGVFATMSDLQQMLDTPDIDCVYIASPNSVHSEQAIAALHAGKHVIVEKPAVPTAAEWDRLVTAATESGVVLLEGIRNEYDPGTRLIRNLLPRLGPIRRVSLRYQKRSSRYDQVLAGERVNMFDPAMGGGALMDLGVYCVHALVTLFGEPDQVMASSVPVATGVDGAGVALASYPGFVADLSYSKISSSRLPSEVQGEEATLLIDHIASPRSLALQHRDGTDELITLPHPQHTLIDEVRRFVHLIESGDSPIEDHQRTRQTLRVMEKIQASIGPIPTVPAAQEAQPYPAPTLLPDPQRPSDPPAQHPGMEHRDPNHRRSAQVFDRPHPRRPPPRRSNTVRSANGSPASHP